MQLYTLKGDRRGKIRGNDATLQYVGIGTSFENLKRKGSQKASTESDRLYTGIYIQRLYIYIHPERSAVHFLNFLSGENNASIIVGFTAIAKLANTKHCKSYAAGCLVEKEW